MNSDQTRSLRILYGDIFNALSASIRYVEFSIQQLEVRVYNLETQISQNSSKGAYQALEKLCLEIVR